MFIHNQVIDAIQDAKKQIVNTFVSDAKFKAELVKLVDAQTEYAKGQVQSTISIAEAFYKNANETFKKAIPAFSK